MNLPKENTLYINFNHTPTLEGVYGIPERRVLHIHGGLGQGGAIPVFIERFASIVKT